MLFPSKCIGAVLILLLTAIFLIFPVKTFADPQSTNYELRNWGFGAGGTESASSNTYSLQGIAGEQSSNAAQSTNYQLQSGLEPAIIIPVPPAPTFTNPATNYDRLHFVIKQASSSADITYALSISSDNFAADIRYVNTDGTVGSSLHASNFQTYTSWGGSAGNWITGLKNNTTYYLRATAQQGKFTQSAWGPIASVATSNSTLTFTLSASSITFNNLTSGNSYTDSSQSTTFTTSTNSYNGYVVYGHINQALTAPGGSTIANYASPNSTPTAWSGTGFGYTTNDTNLTGSGGANRFSSGTLYAGFQTTGSGDPVASDAGPVTSSDITNEQFTVSYKVAASNTTIPGTYTNTILYTIVPDF